MTTPIRIDADMIAWDELRVQKRWLIEHPPTAGAGLSLAEGIVGLIDYLQDTAALTIGETTVFGRPSFIRAFETDNGPGGMSWELEDGDHRWIASVGTRAEAEKLGASAFYPFEMWEAARIAGAVADDDETNIREAEPGGRRMYDDDDGLHIPIVRLATCGTCGQTWDDAVITGITPAPAARCPFEDEHPDEQEGDAFDRWSRDNGLHVTDDDGVIVEQGTRSVIAEREARLARIAEHYPAAAAEARAAGQTTTYAVLVKVAGDAALDDLLAKIATVEGASEPEVGLAWSFVARGDLEGGEG